ncbi:uncharacterized protein LOC143018236 [Oratosquilla oratoria]|uniref:uncharacterized protein LOC143018236 n=1 Tax=Oratosquilla oratoria TaxID=337810 RepID=UPI003F7591AB
MNEETFLPVIDLRLSNGPERADLAKKLQKALTTSGFFYLEGVDGYDAEELHEMTDWFFKLPEDIKMSVTKRHFNPKAKNLYRGYFPVQEGEISHKEGFEIGSGTRNLKDIPTHEAELLFEGNPWPKVPGQEEKATEFRLFVERYYDLLTQAGLQVLRLVAEAWGVPSEFFTPLFQPSPLSTFRLLHYPPRDPKLLPNSARDGELMLQCDEHQDSGFLTMVSTFHYPGLQILKDDKWVSVAPRPGAMVVNIGILLATISGHKLKATYHRVIDFGSDRYSVPFFFEPSYEADMNIRLPDLEAGVQSEVTQREKKDGDRIEYGPWLMKRLAQFCEYRDQLLRKGQA